MATVKELRAQAKAAGIKNETENIDDRFGTDLRPRLNIQPATPYGYNITFRHR